MTMHEELKIRFGIDKANCGTCKHLATDSDGDGYGEFTYCEKRDCISNLKSFPFKTDQKCWKPNFWSSKFTSIINGSNESVDKAFSEFDAALINP